MIEWVLIITMHISAPEGSPMSDVQVEMIDGFESQAACDRAGTTLSLALLAEVGKHRTQHKIDARTKIQYPAIYAECKSIDKSGA